MMIMYSTFQNMRQRHKNTFSFCSDGPFLHGYFSLVQCPKVNFC